MDKLNSGINSISFQDLQALAKLDPNVKKPFDVRLEKYMAKRSMQLTSRYGVEG